MASSSSNHLKTEATPDANGNAKATISISSNAATIKFQGSNTRKLLKYNSSSSLFSCYASGQSPVYIYKKVEATPQANDVYIIGQVDGHDSDPWVSTEGVKMTYNSTNDNYAANIYCTGVNNGTHEGYSLFLFAKSLPYDWNTTSNLYGSGADGSYWGIGGTNESAFGDEIPLYEGSKNSYRLPAGLYTVTVDLDYTGHQYTTKSVKVTKRDVTMTISPNSATFDDTKTVTMASNLTEIGGKIYYTTNGNDPRGPNSGRIEYTDELTIDATTTFKAVAFIGNLYSEVVEKTYTKTPAAPVITPKGGTIYEATQVTITAESGATIYYTTDGSDPTPENGTQYNGAFTVSATTTVKARAYVGDVSSSIATAEFTYSDVQPSTGDFVLVTSADQLVAGNEYIIVTTYDEDDYYDGATTYNYAMGALTTGSNPKGSNTTDFTLTGTIGATGSRIAAGSEVNVLTLGGSAGNWTLKQSNNSYISLADNTNISGTASSTPLLITVDSDEFDAYIGNNGTSNKRQILFSTQNQVFGNYASSNVGNKSYPNVYLYTRESNAVQPPVFTPAGGIYDVTVDVTISCATTGASIYYTTDGTEPTATNGTLYDGNEIVVSNDATFKAVAVKNGNTSSVVTAEYTITPHTAIETVTLDYREPFTSGIGKFTVQNVSGYSPVWTLDGNYGIKGTAYSPNTNPTNNAATSRFLSPIIDMTDAVQPELTFSHQINSYFTDVTNQCQLFIRETTDGTDGNWVQLPITFSDPAAAGGWTNDLVDIDLSNYAGKKVQISFLYTNPTEGSGAGTWEIQNFVVADNSEYRMVNNIAEFLTLENGTKAKFKNPVTVLYDYAQYSSNSYHEYIWVKDESGFMQFYLVPTLNSSTESSLDAKAAYYENGDIIPAGFVVVKNYYENGKYVQAFSAEALEAGFLPATQKGLADPEYMDFDVLDALDASDTEDVATWCNRCVTLEKIKIASSRVAKTSNFQDENGTANGCVGYNKYNGDGSLLKDGTTSADVIMPTDLTKFYDVKGIIQIWQGGWEFMPIEFTEWKEEEMTLRQLCQDGVVGQSYTISNNVLGVFAKDNRLWVKDDTGQSIHLTSQPDGEKSYYIDAEGNTREEQAYYDQSNWLEIILPEGVDASQFKNKIINGGTIKGKFTNKVNPTLEVTSLPDAGAASSYAPNYYCVANFLDYTGNHLSQQGDDGKTYFFMNPKPQEYAVITWAMWKGGMFVIPAKGTFTDKDGKSHVSNDHDFNGAFNAAWDMNAGGDQTANLSNDQNANGMYEFHAVIRKVESTGNSAPRYAVTPKDKQSASSQYVIYPTDLNLSEGSGIITAVSDVKAAGEVLSVTYYNVAGMQSSKPFDGINIVVTRYTDGTASTAKVVR